jgi:hypothetical protein
VEKRKLSFCGFMNIQDFSGDAEDLDKIKTITFLYALNSHTHADFMVHCCLSRGFVGVCCEIKTR